MSTWVSAGVPGVRFRKHPSRRHGVGYDRYFAIHYRVNGKRKDEGIGWASEGWTPRKVALELSTLKRNQLVGEGPQTLKEARGLSQKRRQDEEIKRARIDRRRVTFDKFFRSVYLPFAELNKKPASMKAEKQYYKKWIQPAIGRKPFDKISPIDLERLKMRMLKARLAPRTVELAFAVIRQIWNDARRHGLIESDSPTKQVKIKLNDNRRVRFLTESEAVKLLDSVKRRSLQTYRMAFMSLYTGMRFGEIAGLTWQNIDLEGQLIRVVDSKGRNRSIPMTASVKDLLCQLDRGNPDQLIFPDKNGKIMGRVSNSFMDTVNELGLNDGITDRRQKLVFHSLRHTCASWLVMAGVDLYVVKEILGHASIAMTERYSHLRPGHLRSAMMKLSESPSSMNKPSVRHLNS